MINKGESLLSEHWTKHKSFHFYAICISKIWPWDEKKIISPVYLHFRSLCKRGISAFSRKKNNLDFINVLSKNKNYRHCSAELCALLQGDGRQFYGYLLLLLGDGWQSDGPLLLLHGDGRQSDGSLLLLHGDGRQSDGPLLLSQGNGSLL